MAVKEALLMRRNHACRAAEAWILSMLLTIVVSVSTMAASQDAMDHFACKLPLMDDVIDETLKLLPRSLTDYKGLEKRMRKSVLLPTLQLQYGRDQVDYNLGSNRHNEWESEARIVLSWDLSELIFHNQEADALDVYQKTNRDEIELRSEIAVDYAVLKNALDRLQRENIQDSVELNAKAEQNAAKIDALTSNRFGLVELVHSCSERSSGR